MIVLPRLDEMPGADWSADDGPGKSFLTGAAAPLALGTFRLPDDPYLRAPEVPDDDPASRADTMRERAGQVFQRQRAMGAFNRELDDLFTNIAEGADWSGGLTRFDRELGNLRQKHGANLRSPDDRAAFEHHADSFAAMQRIGLKRALVGRQQADALAQLDDQLAYYAGKAAAAPNEVFRRIAIDAGQRAIAELRDAGYLFPEGAERRQRGFLGLIDGADLETIARANPDEALAILDDPALFLNADAATRQRLRGPLEPRPLPATGNPPPIRTLEHNVDRDGPPPEPVPLNAPATDTASASGPHQGVGVGDYEIPLNAESAREAAEPSGTSASEGATNAREQTPDAWQALLGQMLNMDLGRRQGLTPHDLVDAKPLPDELGKYNLKPGEATEANIDELLPLLRADARKLGLGVVVRWDPSTGAPGFAVRPGGSSAHVAQDDGTLAKGLNRTAEVGYALGSMLGLNFGGPAPGAIATGARAAGTIKASRAADEAVVSVGGTSGPPKGGSFATGSTWRSVLTKAADGFTAVKEKLREQFSRAEKGSPATAEPIDIGPISEEGAKRLNAHLRENGIDLDLTGYRHNVDAYASRHTYKEHGTLETELPRGQLPVTADDWAKIPEILSDFDRASPVGKTDIGREAIGYWKQINGHVLYVEEVRTGRKTLSAVAMRKFKGNLEEVAPGRPDDP